MLKWPKMFTRRLVFPINASRVGLPLSIVLHLLLIYSWQMKLHDPTPPVPHKRALTVRLLTLPEDKKATPKNTENRHLTQLHRAKSEALEKRSANSAIVRQPAGPVTSTPVAGTMAKNDDSPGSVPPAVPGAGELVQNAKRDVGKIDRELRKAHPQLPQTVYDSVQSKLANGIAAAAKRSWISGATTEEIFSPNGTGRRMYKIVTPAGFYCVTYESDSAAAGDDTMQHGVQKIISNCPH
jgi:hypothetical protein